MRLLLAVLSLSGALALPAPGLLRVPRVYNALVTSNQNLSPSRAFPVIQPVVHTTAVGYVPPFYYTQFAPRYPGPEVGRLPQELLPAEGAGLDSGSGKDAASRLNTENAAPVATGDNNNSESERKDSPPPAKSPSGETPKRKEGNQQALSFYPNYHSLYYDPYFYPYNGFTSHLAPSPYLFDYQPQALAPLPPQGAYREQQLLNPQIPETDAAESGKNAVAVSAAEEKIPDVPPPPVPTSSSNKS